MFKINFSSINADQMQPFRYTSMFDVKPWQDLDLSIVKHFKTDIKLYDRCIQKFEALSKNTIHDFDILDILALLVIRHDGWNTPISKTVAQHWWLSVINQHDKEQELLTMLNFLLQYEYGDISQHFGNVVALDHLKQTLIQGKNHHWQDDILKTVTLSILKNDAEYLAQFALKDKRLSIRELSHHYPFTIPDDLKQRAGVFWLNAYLKLSEQKLIEYSSTIQVWLNEQTDIDFAVSRAWSIFDNPYFSKDLVQLENQTHKFGDIFTWLKQWANQPDFKQKLGIKYNQILNAWLGAGNYYQLKKIIEKISSINKENIIGKTNRSVSRYSFWENYQTYIIDFYLIIPSSEISKYNNLGISDIMEQVRFYDSFSDTKEKYPVIILKFEHYYFIQPLVGKAPEVDLIMTTDSLSIKNALIQDKFNINLIKHIQPILVHDHYQDWQYDVEYILARDYSIFSRKNPNKVIKKPATKERPKLLKLWLNDLSTAYKASPDSIKLYGESLRTHQII